MEDLISLEHEIYLGDIPSKDIKSENDFPQIIFTESKNTDRNNKLDFFLEINTLIIYLVIIAATILPALIYDIIKVITSDLNKSGIFQILLDSQSKLFLYFCFQIGVILYLIFFGFTLSYFKITQNKMKKYKYVTRNNVAIIDLLVYEHVNIEQLIRLEWFKDDETIENNVENALANGESLLCRIFLAKMPYYWDFKVILKTGLLKKYLILSTPFFLLSTLSVGYFLIKNFQTGNYIWVTFSLLALFVIFAFISFATIKKKFFIITVTIIYGTIIAAIALSFFVFLNLNAFSFQSQSNTHLIISHNLFLFVFLCLAIIGSLVSIITFFDRWRQVNNTKNYYSNEIKEVEFEISNKEDKVLFTRLMIFYEKTRNLGKMTYFPVNFFRYVVIFSTYFSFVTSISAIFVYIFPFF